MRLRTLLLASAALLLVAACGSGDDDDDAAAATPTDASTAAPVTTSGATGSDGTAGSESASFPVTIEHKYGTTEVPAAPERVVSVGFNDQDTILALGVVPVGIRDWYGDQPSATWPWAHDLLDGAEPVVLSNTELNFEEIATLEPDLIVGVSSGMTEQEYGLLSEIAPTIPQTAEFIDYGMPWQDGTLLIGTALGKRAEAEALVAGVEERIAAIRAAHPEFEGATGTVSYVMSESEIGAYGPQDVRSRLLTDLGFVIPPAVIEAAGDQFYSSFSFEQIGMLDEDVLIWIGADDTIAQRIKAHPLHAGLTAAAEGREIFLDAMESGAASFSSVLSLPYLLDRLEPQLVAAIDGDPATAVPA